MPGGAFLVPVLGAACCIFLMVYLPPASWWRFIGWLVIGAAIYAAYGYSSSVLGRRAGRPAKRPAFMTWMAYGFALAGTGLFVIPHDAGLGQLIVEARDAAYRRPYAGAHRARAHRRRCGGGRRRRRAGPASASPDSQAGRPESWRSAPERRFWEMTGYQWAVLFAAWLGWGFDVFDGLLFNFVAPNCVPTLLGLPIGSPEARAATLRWTGAYSSLLLVGWAAGGILFGRLADRIGRTRTLTLTMLVYATGTALCAFAPNLWMLGLFRLIAALGIGGEWAAGAAMVAEVVPEKRRVEAGALLYTSAPVGLALASFVNSFVAGNLFADRPEFSWRIVFLAGLVPAAVALLVRRFVREPERWVATMAGGRRARFTELFDSSHRRRTGSGFVMALVALLTWWSCNAFIPVVASGLAQAAAVVRGLERDAMLALSEAWKSRAVTYFNWGGLLGTLLTVPAAKLLGRRVMFGIYFLASSAAIFSTFGLDLAARDPAGALFLDRPDRFRGLRQLHLLSARALSDPPAGEWRRLLLQRRPDPRRHGTRLGRDRRGAWH